MNKTKKIALIGCGGRLRGVIEGTLKAAPPGSMEISDLYDPDPGSVAAARELAPGAVSHSSVDELLRQSDAEWVAIGSPNSEHARQVAAALDAGRHVFCEKPLATTPDDCAMIRDAVRRNPDRIFFFGLVLRYSPFYRRVKELLDDRDDKYGFANEQRNVGSMAGKNKHFERGVVAEVITQDDIVEAGIVAEVPTCLTYTPNEVVGGWEAPEAGAEEGQV